jgi:hypothetical protein
MKMEREREGGVKSAVNLWVWGEHARERRMRENCRGEMFTKKKKKNWREKVRFFFFCHWGVNSTAPY